MRFFILETFSEYSILTKEVTNLSLKSFDKELSLLDEFFVIFVYDPRFSCNYFKIASVEQMLCHMLHHLCCVTECRVETLSTIHHK
jgi:hypothetical protein